MKTRRCASTPTFWLCGMTPSLLGSDSPLASSPFLLAILITPVLLAMVVTVVVRRGKLPGCLAYRNYSTRALSGSQLRSCLPLPWLLHKEPLSIGGFLVVMGLASVMTGPVNREEWSKQLDVPTATTNMMIAIALAAILGYLLARHGAIRPIQVASILSHRIRVQI
jgi:hypothetical protein